MAEMELHYVTLDDDRFIGTSFFRTPLLGLDFSTCQLEGVALSDTMAEIYGTKMNVYQAAALARRLGVIVAEWEKPRRSRSAPGRAREVRKTKPESATRPCGFFDGCARTSAEELRPGGATGRGSRRRRCPRRSRHGNRRRRHN